eukprot:1178173-Prorocentrum_minimum.AAC.1
MATAPHYISRQYIIALKGYPPSAEFMVYIMIKPRSRRPKRPLTSIQQSAVTVDTSIPFSTQYFEYSTKCSTYIPCRQTATWLADRRLPGLIRDGLRKRENTKQKQKTKTVSHKRTALITLIFSEVFILLSINVHSSANAKGIHTKSEYREQIHLQMRGGYLPSKRREIDGTCSPLVTCHHRVEHRLP